MFVCESDCAHLGDLGLAMEVTHSSRTILAAHMGGTMEYWPPEKVNADEHTRIDPFKVFVLSCFKHSGFMSNSSLFVYCNDDSPKNA